MIIEELESLKTVLSSGRGFAQYYMWNDKNPSQEDRIGYFVTFVDGTDCIKICDNADEDAIGVVVSADKVGFVGGQSDDVVANSHEYGLVCLIGHALVRRENSVQLGDYVIPNVLGMAQTSNFSTKVSTPYFQSITITGETTYQLAHLPQENTLRAYLLTEDGTLENAEELTIGAMPANKVISVSGTSVRVVVGDAGFNAGDKILFIYQYESPRNLGYKVTALFYYAGVEYAQINLVPNGNALAWIEENINTLLNRIIANEGNVTIAMNRANDAYALAESGGGEANAEIINRLNKVESDVQQAQDTANSVVDNAALKAEEVAGDAVAKAETLAYEAKAEAEEAQKEIETITQIIGDMKKVTDPISIWENADGSVGAEYLLEYIDNDLATKAEVQAVESNIKSDFTAIVQNSKEIQLIASSVQKYCVGEYSQAYQLTLSEANSILPVGVIYAPTADHTEEYETSEGYSTQAFNRGFSYVWRGTTWEESNIENVSFSDIYINPPVGDSVSYWCTGDASITNNDSMYEANTLYEGTQDKWTKVASLQDSSISRIASATRVTANEIALEVIGKEGYAGLKTRVDDAEVAIENITNLTTDETSALAMLKQQVTDNEANISQLTEFTYTVSMDSKKLSEEPGEGVYYTTLPEWSDETKQWTFSGDSQNKPGFYDGAEYCYASNPDNKQTYLHYICDENNQWYVVEKGIGKSLASVQQQADANTASVAVVVGKDGVIATPIVTAINELGETDIKLNADRINFEGQDFTVSADNIDFTAGDYKISAEHLEIDATQGIDLTGYVQFTDLSDPESTTAIDGSLITTGIIQSENYEENIAGSQWSLVDGSFDTVNFKVDSMGNIVAPSGTIGGNTIDSTGLHITTGDITLGENFLVTAEGDVTAKSGTIGDCSIVDGVLQIGLANISEKLTANQIEANAITGEQIAAEAITSTRIASYAITSDKIATNALKSTNYKVGTAVDAAHPYVPQSGHSSAGTFFDLSSGAIYAPKFYLDANGKIHATEGEFTGTIHANAGDFGALKIDNASLYIENQGGILRLYNSGLPRLSVGSSGYASTYGSDGITIMKANNSTPIDFSAGGWFSLFNGVYAYVLYLDHSTNTVKFKEVNINLISFTLGATTLQATRDMTWAEWIKSSYNTANMHQTGNNIGIDNAPSDMYVCRDGEPVLATDTIIDGGSYTFE